MQRLGLSEDVFLIRFLWICGAAETDALILIVAISILAMGSIHHAVGRYCRQATRHAIISGMTIT